MKEYSEAVIFELGDIRCGLSIAHVQEICKNPEITRVYLAPPNIAGVINLRGQVVTIINLRQIFGIPEADVPPGSRVIIVDSEGERIGLMVDFVHDIIEIDRAYLEIPPSNIRGVAGDLFIHIYKKPDELISILNLEEVLRI